MHGYSSQSADSAPVGWIDGWQPLIGAESAFIKGTLVMAVVVVSCVTQW